MTRLLTIPLRAPRLTLAVVLAVTVVLGFYARQIKVDSSIENLLPAHNPDRVYYEDVRRTFGSEEVTVIGVFADDVFAPATLAKIATLSKRIAAIDGVREVLSLATVKSVEMGDDGLTIGRLMRRLPETPAEAAEFRARALANPLYLKNVVSADGHAAGVTVVFEPMSGEEFIERGIEDAIRRLAGELEGPEHFAVTGIPTIKVNGARLMERDIATFTPLSVLVIACVLFWAFRTPRGVLVPLSTVLVGLIWTVGLMVLAGSSINMGTLVLPPLLITVGIAYAIHVMSQYYQEVRPGRTAADVVRHAMEHVGLPVFVCGITTLIGFLPFVFSPIRAIWDFGVYSLFGVIVVVLATFTVPPAVLALLPLPTRVHSAHSEEGWLTGFLERLGSRAVQRPRATLALVLLVSLGLALGVRHVQVETDYLSYFSARSQVRVENALISERLAGTQPVYVVMDGTGPESVTRLDTLAAMRELQDFIDAQPGVDKTISLADYLVLVRRTLRPEVAGTLPSEQNEVDQLLLLVDPKDVQAVVNRDYSRANIVVRTRLSGSEEVGDFVSKVEAFGAEHFPRGITVHATGTIVLLNRSADTLAWGEISSLWQVVVVLLVVMSFLFLSLRIGLISLIPNVLPIAVLYGIMGWMDISLSISTAMIASIAIGIAIDDTIHLFSAFNTAVKRTGSQELAIAEVMQSVGRAVTFTTVALAAGFLIVCFSNFQPVRYFGALSAVTMAVGIVVELLVTPALLATTKIITVWDLLRLKIGRDPEKQIPLFEGLRPFQAKIVVLMGELTSASRGTSIARRGEMKAELYVLLSGHAEVQRDGGHVVRTLARGDVVGEMGMVRKAPRSADVVVTEDAEYLVLHEDFVRRLRRRYPRIAATVLLNLSRILSDRLERTTDLLAGAMRARAAADDGARAGGSARAGL